MKRILYFIQLPPPVHGVSTINKYVFDSEIINQNLEKKLLEIKFSDKVSELMQINFSKLFRFINLFFKLFISLIKYKPKFVYFSIMPVGKGFYRDLLFVILIKLFSVKLIFHIHNAGIAKQSKNKITNFLYRAIFNKSAIIHLSEGLRKKEFENLKLKKSTSFIVNNGIEEINHNIEKQKSENINILFLSNLFPEKGVFTILNIFKELYVENKNIRLNIIGDDFRNEKQKVISFIINNNLENVISVHENIYGDDKITYFTTADIFAFPSQLKCESFPLVLLEAMQYKLSIVAFNIGGVSEIIQNNKTGYILDLEDKIGFKNKLNQLITDSNLRIRLGENGNVIFQKKYTKKIFENNMKQVFDEIMN